MPAETERASILLVHGYAEHCGRYDELARYLCRFGIAVHAYDQRGAGDSDGTRGRIHHFSRLVDDLAAFVRHVPENGSPRFIMGHSLGGAVVMEYLLSRQPPGFAGAIFSSPAIRIITPFPEVAQKLLVRVASLVPVIPTLPLDREGLSRDPDVVADAYSDEKNYLGRVPLGTAGQMISAGPRILERAEIMTLPTLIFVGTADTIVHPMGSFELYGRIGSSDKTLAIYEGLYHETFREPEKYVVMDGLRLWLEERLADV